MAPFHKRIESKTGTPPLLPIFGAVANRHLGCVVCCDVQCPFRPESSSALGGRGHPQTSPNRLEPTPEMTEVKTILVEHNPHMAETTMHNPPKVGRQHPACDRTLPDQDLAGTDPTWSSPIRLFAPSLLGNLRRSSLEQREGYPFSPSLPSQVWRFQLGNLPVTLADLAMCTAFPC